MTFSLHRGEHQIKKKENAKSCWERKLGWRETDKIKNITTNETIADNRKQFQRQICKVASVQCATTMKSGKSTFFSIFFSYFLLQSSSNLTLSLILRWCYSVHANKRPTDAADIIIVFQYEIHCKNVKTIGGAGWLAGWLAALWLRSHIWILYIYLCYTNSHIRTQHTRTQLDFPTCSKQFNTLKRMRTVEFWRFVHSSWWHGARWNFAQHFVSCTLRCDRV